MKNPLNLGDNQRTAKTFRRLPMPRLTFVAVLLGVLWISALNLFAQKPLPPCTVTQTILYSNSVYSGPNCEWLESDDFPFQPTQGHFMTIVNTNYVSVSGALGGIPLNPSMPTGATNLNVSITGKRLQTKLDLSTNAANWYISIMWIAWKDDCSSCISQGAAVVNNSVEVAVRLGKDNFGRSSGQLLLDFETPTNLLAQPAGLQAQLADGVEAITNSGVLRQVRTSQMLADIVTSNATSYAVNYYHTNAFSSTKGTNGLYPPVADSYLSVAISDPDGGTNTSKRLRVLQTGDLGTQQYDYVWSDSPAGWTLTSGSGGEQRREVRTKLWTDSTTCITTNEIRDASNNLVFKKIETFKAYPDWGMTNLTAQTIGPDTAVPQTSTWTYCTNATDPNYRQLTLVTRPDGSWEKRDYDSCSRVIRKMTPFGDSPYTAASNECRMTEYVYVDEATKRWTMETDYVLGQETGRRFHVVNGDITWEVVCTTNGVGYYTNANTLATVTTHSADTNAAYAVYGEPLSIQHSDGTLSVFSYNFSGDGLTKTNTEWRGAPNSNYTSVTNGTCTVTVSDQTGQQISKDVYAIVGSQLELLTSSWVSSRDGLGRPTRTDYSDGTCEIFTNGCCGLESSIDREGIATFFDYDSLKRPTLTTRAGISEASAFDAAGNVIQSWMVGANSGYKLISASSFDQAGRLLATTNALNGVTSYAETSDTAGRVVQATTYPDGSIRVQTNHLDRTPLSITGTAVHPIAFVYNVDGDGEYVQKIKLGASGATDEWVRRYKDYAGRPYKTLYPNNSSEQSYFNAQGQVVKEVGRDGQVRLYRYNTRSEVEHTAIHLDTGDEINFAGTDRILRTVSEVATHGTTVVQRVSTWDWPTTGDNPRLVNVADASVDGRNTWVSSFGRSNRTETVLSGSGGKTVTATEPDGSYTVSVFTNGLLLSATRYASNSTPIDGQTIGYNEFGRQVAVTDARNVTVSNVLDAADRVLAVIEVAPGLAARITSNVLNQAGRPLYVIQPDGGVVTNLFLPTGELTNTCGARTYPVAFGFDPQGRKTSMTTWTNFAARSGAAITSWAFDPSLGFLTGKTYADNSAVLYTNSGGGRLQTRLWARGIATSYGYNGANDLLTVTHSDGTPGVTNTYDRLGRVQTVSDGVSSRTLGYNEFGQVTNETYTTGLLSGCSVVRSFDTLGRLLGVSVGGVTGVLPVSYGYDSASRLQTVGFGGNTVTYDYAPNSALVSGLTYSNGLIAALNTVKSYDGLGRLTNITSSAVSPTSVTQSVVNSFSYQYNTADQRTTNTFADGSYWSYGYDGLGQVTNGARKWASGEAVAGQQFGYAINDIGNWSAAVVNGRTANYTANNLNQYTQRTVPGALDVLGSAHSNAALTVNGQAATRQGAYYHQEIAVTNSAAAVWQPISVVGTLTGTGTNNPDIIVTNSGSLFLPQTPEAFTFDLDGNQTSDGRWTNTWDGENRLISMETCSDLSTNVPHQKIICQYDSRWHRVSKVVSNFTGGVWVEASNLRFIYDGWNLLAEIGTGGSVARSYVWGLDLSGSMQGAGGVGGLLAMTAGTNGTHFVACDGNGNVVQLFKSNDAAVTAVYEYAPFGDTLRATGPMAGEMPFRFSTRYTDHETGFQYCDMRYYHPDQGRWLSRDPITEANISSKVRTFDGLSIPHVDSDSLNEYVYVVNSPINEIDLLGLATLKNSTTNPLLILVKFRLSPDCIAFIKTNYNVQLDRGFHALYILAPGMDTANMGFINDVDAFWSAASPGTGGTARKTIGWWSYNITTKNINSSGWDVGSISIKFLQSASFTDFINNGIDKTLRSHVIAGSNSCRCIATDIEMVDRAVAVGRNAMTRFPAAK